MKKKICITVLILFTAYLSGVLLISLICGAPMENRAELNRYLFGAVGMAIVLPAGFSYFLASALHLGRKLDEIEEAERKEKRSFFGMSEEDMLIQPFVNALSKKENLTQEKRDDLISYIEDL